ncbi:mitotic checkpoint protein BUB3.3-like isoform X1 [Hordeum vulgare subsp. vulgare]|uniref:Mitotic checkpoint protein BUB3.3 n=1 Tax=Hordeum vulgare subsp. vulgare TaxID=112509 RepID=A0A8I6XTN3_HORVV|nr:mitotic checkpoint protein BUB3.3-like isoform X1 [Hordeum vulgare subsp. vulgare]
MARRGLAADAGAVSRVRFAPSSNNLMVSSWDSGLRLYDADKSILRLEANSEAALLDCCFKDESVAFAGGSDGCVIRYDLNLGAQDTVGLHDDVVVSTEFSQVTSQLVTSSLDKKLFFWDTHTRSVNHNNSFKLDSVVVSLSVCGMYILVTDENDVYWYDMRNLTGPIKAKDSPLKHHIRCLCASAEWNGYVAGSMDGTVAVKYFDHDVDNDMGYTFRCHPRSKDGNSSLVPINNIAIHPSKQTFVTGDNEGYAIAWDALSKKKLLEFPSFSGSVASMAYNHTGQLLAVASNYTHQGADRVLEVEGHQIFIETTRDSKREKSP